MESHDAIRASASTIPAHNPRGEIQPPVPAPLWYGALGRAGQCTQRDVESDQSPIEVRPPGTLHLALRRLCTLN